MYRYVYTYKAVSDLRFRASSGRTWHVITPDDQQKNHIKLSALNRRISTGLAHEGLFIETTHHLCVRYRVNKNKTLKSPI